MDSKSKLPTTYDFDKIIFAEILDKTKDPEFYEVIKDCMIHRPWGADNTNSPCMVVGNCSKQYLKQNQDITKVGSVGYHVYRRRNSNHFVDKKGIKCDNRYVVPYNAKVSVRYQAHINVEWCN